MAKSRPSGGLFGKLQAGAAAGLSDLWQDVLSDTEAEFGNRSPWTHLARAVTQHYGGEADRLAELHGYDPQRQPLPAPRRNPSPEELWQAGRAAQQSGNGTLALRYVAAAAEQGHPQAAARLAGFFELGEQGVAQDFHAAALWYHRALEAGETVEAAKGLSRVGQAFQKGNGVARDVTAAVQLYQLAAGAGDAGGRFYLAWYLRRGAGGLAQDREEARRLFHLAARQGITQAAHELDAMDTEDRPQLGSGSRQQQPPPPSGGGRMTRAEALDVIDMKEGASSEAMRARWTQLMQKHHPDRPDGSTYFAKQLNEARDVLGF